jgi:hypothetical protein
MKRLLSLLVFAAIASLAAPSGFHANRRTPAQSAFSPQGVPLAEFVGAIRQKAKTLENSL